jgi:hypothetical protein
LLFDFFGQGIGADGSLDRAFSTGKDIEVAGRSGAGKSFKSQQ